MDLPIQQFKTRTEQDFVDLFTLVEQGLPGASNAWVKGLRVKAIEAYRALGLPHRRIEEWKYTDLRSRLTEAYAPVRAVGRPVENSEIAEAIGNQVAALDSYQLLIVEGELRPGLSDIAALKSAGVEVHALGEVLERPAAWLKEVLEQVNPQEKDAIIALNTALMTGGAALRIGQGVTLNKPIHLIHLESSSEPIGTVTRNVVVVEEGASATILESYGGTVPAGLQRNAVTELAIGNGSAVTHLKLQREDEAAFHLVSWLVSIGADARYDAFQFSTGAALARNQLYVRFAGEEGAANISGAMLMRGRQHCDTTLLVNHAVPRCAGRELFKAVLDDEARAVFQGKIIVAPGAQKTDSKQVAQGLLLSESAEFDSKPELEIFADDVVCGHGSTSGQVDEELLFYLRARGIPEAEARALLVQAFIGEALELIEGEPLREALTGLTAAWLRASAK